LEGIVHTPEMHWNSTKTSVSHLGRQPLTLKAAKDKLLNDGKPSTDAIKTADKTIGSKPSIKSLSMDAYEPTLIEVIKCVPQIMPPRPKNIKMENYSQHNGRCHLKGMMTQTENTPEASNNHLLYI